MHDLKGEKLPTYKISQSVIVHSNMQWTAIVHSEEQYCIYEVLYTTGPSNVLHCTTVICTKTVHVYIQLCICTYIYIHVFFFMTSEGT